MKVILIRNYYFLKKSITYFCCIELRFIFLILYFLNYKKLRKPGHQPLTGLLERYNLYILISKLLMRSL